MTLPQVLLKPREEGRLLGGHPWAFSNEIVRAPQGVEPGILVDLYKAGPAFLARGFYNPHSLIAFRSLTSQPEEISDAFFETRLREALDLRARFYPGQTAYRWVFGESDRLPGLIVDRFGEYMTIQAVAAGMERLKESLVRVIAGLVSPKGIVWRADSALRTMEGLPTLEPEVVLGEVPPRISIETENGVFSVDLLEGQKTGFYFDQRENRQALAAYCKGRKVLDAFCYSGGFGIAAARAGAREVVFNDTAKAALELVDENIRANGLATPVALVEGDVHKLLAHEPPGGPFEVISIDPPAFARSKKHLPAALKSYEKLNAEALARLARGGVLASSSCSHHVTPDLFIQMLRKAARKAHKNVRLLEFRSQAKDHPVLLAMPETEYLKCAIVQVI